MRLADELRGQCRLPAICAPMMLVSGPELVSAACHAGIGASLPWHNARTPEEYESWLKSLSAARAQWQQAHPHAPLGPLIANITIKRPQAELITAVDMCIAHGVRHFITALGNPAEAAQVIHDRGGFIFHDITNVRFAEKALHSGVDGLICIGGGGGGHSGTLNPFALIPAVRALFDGLLVFAGCVSDGASIRAAEILGADMVYLGTRFIATKEARAPDAYKNMLVAGRATDLTYTSAVTGVHANWLNASLQDKHIDPAQLPPAVAGYGHLPEGVKPWRDLWSAGQGIDLIHDIPDVATLVERLRREYIAACTRPHMADAAL